MTTANISDGIWVSVGYHYYAVNHNASKSQLNLMGHPNFQRSDLILISGKKTKILLLLAKVLFSYSQDISQQVVFPCPPLIYCPIMLLTNKLHMIPYLYHSVFCMHFPSMVKHGHSALEHYLNSTRSVGSVSTVCPGVLQLKWYASGATSKPCSRHSTAKQLQP